MEKNGSLANGSGEAVKTMIPKPFDYHSPDTLDEALDLFDSLGSKAKILAGGQSLIPIMKLRLAAPEHIIDLNRIRGLDYIKDAGDKIVIGALTRHSQILNSSLLNEKIPIMHETAKLIGDYQVRNLGTLAGSLVHCDPGGDWGSCMIALHAELKIKGKGTSRSIPIDDFLVDTFQSSLKPNEILTEVIVPVPKGRSGGAYVKFERKAGDFASVAIASQLSLDHDGNCNYIGIGLTAVGPTNLRARKAEQSLLGKKVDSSSIEEASAAASEECSPVSDPVRGSAEYKRAMVRVYAERSLRLAHERALKK
jgi:aerobic carbon-monoxide dehydrogenase medium subunit